MQATPFAVHRAIYVWVFLCHVSSCGQRCCGCAGDSGECGYGRWSAKRDPVQKPFPSSVIHGCDLEHVSGFVAVPVACCRYFHLYLQFSAKHGGRSEPLGSIIRRHLSSKPCPRRRSPPGGIRRPPKTQSPRSQHQSKPLRRLLPLPASALRAPGIWQHTA